MAKKQRSIAAKKESIVATKEVALKAEPQAPVVASENPNAWGAAPVSAQDIIIPRILLMQPMSEAVTEGDAAFGDMVESLSNEKVGDLKTPLEVVPFLMRKIFVEYDVTNGTDMKNKKFLRVTPITPQNENLPYNDEETRDGKRMLIMRDYVREFYVLRVDELKLGATIPYTISFRRSSAQAGKKLATQMYVKNLNAGKTPASVTVMLTVNKTTNDQGTFGTFDIAPNAPTDIKYIAEAFKWLQLVNQGSAKVADESYAADDGVTATHEMPAAGDGPGRF